MRTLTLITVTLLLTYLSLAFMASNSLSQETAYNVLMNIKASQTANAGGK